MTIPRLRGIGDSLLEAAPGLAVGLRKIFRPEADLEDAFQQAITNDPTLIDKLIELDTANPGSIAGMYGKKAQAYVMNKQLSPTARLNQEQKQNESTLTKQQIEKNKIAFKDRAEVDKYIAKFRSENPEAAEQLATYHAMEQKFGTTPEHQAELKEKASELTRKIAASKTAVKFLQGKNLDTAFTELYGDINSETGEFTPPTADALTVGAIDSAPEAEGFRKYAASMLDKRKQEAILRRQMLMQEQIALRMAGADEKKQAAKQKEIDALTKKTLALEIRSADAQINAAVNNINKIVESGERVEEQLQPLVTQVNEILKRRADYQQQLSGNIVLPNTFEMTKEKKWKISRAKYGTQFKDAEGNVLNDFKANLTPKPSENKEDKKAKTDTTSKSDSTNSVDEITAESFTSDIAKQAFDRLSNDAETNPIDAMKQLNKIKKYISPKEYEALKKFIDSWGDE
jgi:hypothetical protein